MRSELSYFLSVILLVGAVGGLALGAIEAARSTDSSFADFVASSHVPQLFVFDGVINPGIGLDSAYNPALLRTLSHLPHVERVESTVELNLGPLTAAGKPLPEPAIVPAAEASVGGLDFNEDPVAITEGRMVDPRKADEVVVDAASAKALGYHLGEEIPVGWVTNAQIPVGQLQPEPADPGSSTGAGEARRDRRRAGDHAVPGPGRRQRPVDHAVHARPDEQAPRLLQQRHGQRADAAGRRPPPLGRGGGGEGARSPRGSRSSTQQSADIIATANATLRPETIALSVFGGITGIAALLIAGQVISRRVRLRALGPRHRPGPRSGPPDVPVGRPPRLARCPAARFVARRRCGRGPLAARAARDRCGRSSAWRSIRTGRSSGSAC